MSRSVEDVAAELKFAKERVSELTAELDALRMDEAGVHPGDVVLAVKGEVKVTKVDARWDGKPWIKGVLRKKDGTWSKQERHFFSGWESA